MKDWLKQAGWKLIDILFPPRCVGCGEWGKYWCERCLQNVEIIQEPFCKICGEPLSIEEGEQVCRSCQTSPPAFRTLRSWAVFGDDVQQALHQLKYRKNIFLGRKLGEVLHGMLQVNPWNVDLVAPVPLGTKRKKQRGYNQAMLIARPLARLAGVPVSGTALQRVRETRTQVGLSIQERKRNVAGAFKADPGQVAGKTILVVDDVTTTGSTLNACASALRKEGAAEVHGLTFARALRISNAA